MTTLATAIGFAGLGSMGSAMARNLLAAGYAVTAYNRSPERTRPLADAGATVVAFPGEAARCGIVVTMVADDAALESLVFGERGILAGLPAGGLHLSMSTVSVALAERLTKAHRDAGQEYLAAPVFGRPDAAAAKKLFVVAGGPEAVLARAQPLLDAMGQQTFHIGDTPSQANMLKLCGNFLITCVIEGLAEALTLGTKAGIDRTRMLDVFTSTLFGAPVYKNYGKMIADERFTPVGFALPLGLKDNRLLLQAAEALIVPLPFANTLRDRFLEALASGYGDEDWSAIARVAGNSAGLRSGNLRPNGVTS